MVTARPAVKVASISQAGIVSLVDQDLGAGLKTLLVPTPTLSGHPATKLYVDGLVAPLASSSAVASAIATAVAPLATSTAVTSAISTAIAPLATSASVATAISSAHAALTLGTASGLSLAGQVLSLALASGSAAGAMSSADFLKLAGVSGSNTGDVTLGTANGLSLVGQAVSLALATGSTAGALSAAGFTTLSTQSGTNTGDVTLGAIGSTANANGASLSGQVLTLQPASVSFGGVVTTGAQSFVGEKRLTTSLFVGEAPSNAGGAILAVRSSAPYMLLETNTSSAANGYISYGNTSTPFGWTLGANPGTSAADTKRWEVTDLNTTHISIRAATGGNKARLYFGAHAATVAADGNYVFTHNLATDATGVGNDIATLVVKGDLGTTNHGGKIQEWKTSAGSTVASLSLAGGFVGTTVDASGVMTSTVASGSQAILLTSGARIGDASRYFTFGASGIATPASIVFYSDNIRSVAANTIRLYSSVANGASAVATALDSSVTLSTAGAKITSFRVLAAEKAFVDVVGGVRSNAGNAALPTAGTSYRGCLMFGPDAANGVADKLYCCMKSTLDTYSWVQVATAV